MPDLTSIVSRLEPVLGEAAAAPVPLDGGITNHNFRVTFAGRECVVRLPGKDTALLGIDRGAEGLAARQAASLGIAPPLLYSDSDCSVTAYVPSHAVDPDELRADPATVARALRAFHDSGVSLPTRFWIPEQLADYAAIVEQRGGGLPERYLRAQALVGRIAAALPLEDPVPCHDDLLPGNLIQTDETILLVDWEYAGMGHRYFDLGNLAVNNEFDEVAEERLLTAYFGERAKPGRTAALRLFRIVSDAREAAWGVLQGLISDVQFDFADYAATHFDRLERAAADPRVEDYLVAVSGDDR